MRSSSYGAVVRRSFRQVRVAATAWGLVFGATAATSALNYVSAFPTLASRQQIAATTGRDTGFAILLGPVSAIDTVGGYTVYKCFVFLTAIGAVWGLVIATRLLRGEEDTGRWQLVLAGVTTAPRATAAVLAALAAAVAVVLCGTVLILLLTGRDSAVGLGPWETVLYGVSVTVPAVVFAVVGAVTSQLAGSRRVATSLGLAVFGVTFVLRMIGDSGPSARWLLWLTPFGWTELIRPYTQNDLWPLVPAVGTTLVLGAAAVVLAARRDAGAGLLASRDVTRLRPFGLRSPLGLAVRLELPLLSAWCAGTAAAAFAFGVIAKVVTGRLPESFGTALDRFGVQGSLVNQFLGVAFLLTATLVALIPVSYAGAAGEEETSGRLVHVLVGPVRRARLFAGRLALHAVAVGVAGLLAGLAAWLGARSQGVDVDLGATVGAGLNLVPTALVALGVGALVLAVAPRAAAAAVYVAVVGSLIIYLLGTTVAGLHWVQRLSLFHYMALAPSQGIDPQAVLVTLLGASVLCALATALFVRRDLRSA